MPTDNEGAGMSLDFEDLPLNRFCKKHTLLLEQNKKKQRTITSLQGITY